MTFRDLSLRSAFVSLALTIIFSAAAHAGEAEDKIAIARLKAIGTLLRDFITTHKGRIPQSLDELSAFQKVPDPALLLSPTAVDKSKPSYELFSPGDNLNHVVSPARTVMLVARFTLSDGRIPIVYASGNVRLLEAAK